MDSSVPPTMHAVRRFFRFPHIAGFNASDPAVHAELPEVHRDESRNRWSGPPRTGSRCSWIRFLQLAWARSWGWYAVSEHVVAALMNQLGWSCVSGDREHLLPRTLEVHVSRTRTMLTTAVLAAASTAAVVQLSAPVSAQDGGRPLTATLTGAAEVPGPGDKDGTGTAVVRVNPGQREICYTLTVKDISPATAAHIHAGQSGKSGPVVIELAAPTGGSVSTCKSVTRELAKQLIASPESYYVNVHNAEFGAGAVRGQLSK